MSIAILGISVATVGELIRVGALAAANTRDMATAQMMAETKMSEISAGLYPLSPVAEAVDEFDPQWSYSVEIQQIDQDGLIGVRITIQQNLPESQRPVRYELVRWLLEDDLIIEDETTEDDGSTTDSSTSSGSSSSGGAAGAGDGGAR